MLQGGHNTYNASHEEITMQLTLNDMVNMSNSLNPSFTSSIAHQTSDHLPSFQYNTANLVTETEVGDIQYVNHKQYNRILIRRLERAARQRNSGNGNALAQ